MEHKVMAILGRRKFILSALAVPVASCGKSAGSQIDNEPPNYRVQNPLAGYFDLSERRRIMRSSKNPVLMKLRTRLKRGPSCRQVNEIPIQDKVITLPTFYGDNAAWRQAVKPFWAIENAVSKLAAANLVAEDRRFADCLVNLLLRWAQHDAMSEFGISSKNKQGWFQIESTLFAMALALAAIRTDVLDRDEDLRYIDAWLRRIAIIHFSIPGGAEGTCCNNHFYRRSLYATIIGVMVQDNDLFNIGTRAIHTALSDSTPEGALPLEMIRGDRAAHYQNFSLMYLAMIAQIIERQGYSVWGHKIRGKSLHTLVNFNNRILADPKYVSKYSGTKEVYLKFHKDSQYFAWFEMYLAKFRNVEMEAWIAKRRPLYNRSLGGHLTAYFYSGR